MAGQVRSDSGSCQQRPSTFSHCTDWNSDTDLLLLLLYTWIWSKSSAWEEYSHKQTEESSGSTRERENWTGKVLPIWLLVTAMEGVFIHVEKKKKKIYITPQICIFFNHVDFSINLQCLFWFLWHPGLCSLDLQREWYPRKNIRLGQTQASLGPSEGQSHWNQTREGGVGGQTLCGTRCYLMIHICWICTCKIIIIMIHRDS